MQKELPGCANQTPLTHSPTMKTFRNANFTSRNYECTNVVCCQAVSIEQAQASSPNAKWVECSETEIKGSMSQLWIQGGVKFFGWM